MSRVPVNAMATTRRHVRCAIYTRKSTEEGLEQAFNSLDAQREACAAYIVSQRHEGWVASDELYDDGGYSGGNMDRPGLKQLLAEVQAGRIDVIVVYKVDRLTRALSDFAQIVDVLNAAGASFVSITQSFNTTTSMGRLTLNVLLSFAQFEREVISERVRDKVAASKRKGMWMGGTVPLGYDLRERKLHVNSVEAVTVRHILDRYVELGSVRSLMLDLARDGIVSKAHRAEDGRIRGGEPFGRGALYGLLASHVYIGEVTHKGAVYAGEQAAIVERSIWDEVQATLARNRIERSHQSNASDPSVLAGMIIDGDGRRMTPSHACKGSLRYRSYVTAEPISASAASCIAAGDIERAIIGGLSLLLSDHASLLARIVASTDAARLSAVSIAAARLAQDLAAKPPARLRALLLAIDLRMVIHADRIEASIDATRLGEQLGHAVADSDETRVPLIVPSIVVRRGGEVRLTILPPSSPSPARRDTKLVELLVRAHAAQRQLALDGRSPISQAPMAGARRADLLRLARLSFLAPDITTAILDGSQPFGLGVRKLIRLSGLPASWAEQRVMLGFH